MLYGDSGINCKFAIGDRVESVVDAPHNNPSIKIGAQGTVVCIWRRRVFGNLVGVQWDELVVDGHSCDMNAASGHGWNVSENELRLAVPESNDEDMCVDEAALFSSILA